MKKKPSLNWKKLTFGAAIVLAGSAALMRVQTTHDQGDTNSNTEIEQSSAKPSRSHQGQATALESNFISAEKIENPGSGYIELFEGSAMTDATVESRRISKSHVRLTVFFPKLVFTEKTLQDGINYQTATIPGTSTKSLGEGLPNLPIKPLMLRIPNGRDFEVSQVSGPSYVVHDVNLAPEQPRALADEQVAELAFAKDAAFYETDSSFPSSGSYDTQRIGMRHKEFVQVMVAPVAYNPEKQQLTVTSSVEIDVRVDESMENDRDVSPLYSRAFEEMVSEGHYSFVTSSADDLKSPEPAIAQAEFAEELAEAEDYLPTLPVMPSGTFLEKYMVIYNDQFHTNEVFQSFLEWKRQKGYDVIPVTTGEIKGGAKKCTSALINSYLKGLPDEQWPTYLLLVGNHSASSGVEMYSRHLAYSETPRGDQYYSLRSHNQEVNENWADTTDPSEWIDEYPDCLIGRIPSDNNEMLTRMITKMMKVDRTPLDSSFYNRAIITGALDGPLDSPEPAADAMGAFFEQAKYDTDGIVNTDANDTNVIRAFNGGNYTAGEWVTKGESILWPARSMPSHNTINGEWQVSDGFVNKNLPNNATARQVLKAEWGNGAALVTYNCHGAPEGWVWTKDSDNRFSCEDAAALDSGGKHSLVLDWSCSTAKWVDGANVTQELLQNQNGGAYAMFASCLAQRDLAMDLLHFGYLSAKFDDFFSYFADHYNDDTDNDSAGYPAYGNPVVPISYIPGQGQRIGQMLWCGKVYTLEQFPPDTIKTQSGHPLQPVADAAPYGNVHRHTLFGDPEMFFHYTMPQVLDVNHTTSLASTNGTDTVNITVQSAGSNVANALVALYHPGMGIHASAVTNADGNASFTIPVHTAGAVAITVTASDHAPYRGGVAIGANDAPQFTEPTESIGTAYPGEIFFGSVASFASDTNNDGLTFTKIDGADWLSVSASGTLSGTPTHTNHGTNTLTIQVSDASGASNSASFEIYTAADIGGDYYMLMMNTTLTVDALGILGNDQDTSLTPHIVTQPANGIIELNQEGSFTYTPNTNFFGEDSITYYVSDGVENSLNAIVTFKVEADILAAWEMDEATGSVMNDSSLHQHDGALTNTAWTQGISGSALQFNGSSSMVEVPHTDILRMTEGSVSFWTNTSATPTQPMFVAGKTKSNKLSGWLFAVEANGTISGQLNGGGATSKYKLTGPVINDGNWHHVALTYENGNALTLFVDGEKVASINSVDYYSPCWDPVYMGKWNMDNFEVSNNFEVWSGFVPYSGILDEFQFYGRSLTDSEIVKLYNESNPSTIVGDDSYVTDMGQALNVAQPGVLSNDTASSGSITAAIETQPANGSVNLNSDGSFVYIPVADFMGTDTFEYTATSDGGFASTGTVSITVGDLTAPLDSNNDGVWEIGAIGSINWLADNNQLGPFNSLADKLAADYTLTADVDMSGNPNLNPIGSVAHPFTGSFDGMGFTMSDLTINRPTQGAVAFFGATDNAEIKNVTINSGNISGNGKVAGLIGNALRTTVDDCSVNADILGASNTGGLIGCATSTIITHSHAKGTISCVGNNAGGLVGNLDTCTVSGCYAQAAVSGAGKYHAGFIGYQTGTTAITNCYATGDVSSTGGCASGFMGYLRSATLNYCYASGTAVNYDFTGDVFKSAATFNHCVYRSDASSGPANEGKGAFTNCLEVADITGLQLEESFSGWDFGPATEVNNGYFWSLDASVNNGQPVYQLPTVSQQGTLALEMNVDGSIKLSFEVEAGRSYCVEYSSDMVNWFEWTTPIPVSETKELLDLTDDGQNTIQHPNTASQRFYRLVEITEP